MQSLNLICYQHQSLDMSVIEEKSTGISPDEDVQQSVLTLLQSESKIDQQGNETEF